MSVETDTTAAFEGQVAKGLRETGVAAGASLLVAVSGGADSTSLLLALSRLAPQLGLELSAAHLDHRLRPDSEQDARWVATRCAELGLPCQLGVADIRALAARRGGGLEEAGREARNDFLRQSAERSGASCVALAHTRDDQAETVLLRLTRGAGMTGLTAVLPRRDDLFVRPLLWSDRSAVEAYLRGLGQNWLEDPSNLDIEFSRNRIRQRVLPELRRLNPRVTHALARSAAIARDEDAFLDQLASVELARLAFAHDELGAADLAALPTALARRVVRLAIARVRGSLEGVSLEHVEAALGLATGQRPALSTDLPGGLRFKLERGRLVLGPPAAAAEPFGYQLAVPGHVDATASGWRIQARLTHVTRPLHSGARVHLHPGHEGQTLLVRSRQAGDAFRPQGGVGRRALKRYLNDHKVPGRERAKLPVVTDGQSILWVGGYAVAQHAAATGSAGEAIELSMEQL